MIVRQVQQGTSAWMELRAGIPTTSNFDRIMTAGAPDWKGEAKGAPKASEQRHKYMHHLLAERILQRPIDGFQSAAMADGNQFEDRVIGGYELDNLCETERVGFVTTDDGLIGCSPDRFRIGPGRIGVEAKSPTPPVHVSYMLAAAGCSHEYKVQLQGQIWVCELDCVDIVAYCPGMPTCTFRMNRDDLYIKELSAHVRAFSGQLEEMAEKFKERGWIKPKEVPAAEDNQFLNDDDIKWAMEYSKGIQTL
jgi:hypothetical protein